MLYIVTLLRRRSSPRILVRPTFSPGFLVHKVEHRACQPAYPQQNPDLGRSGRRRERGRTPKFTEGTTASCTFAPATHRRAPTVRIGALVDMPSPAADSRAHRTTPARPRRADGGPAWRRSRLASVARTARC